MKRRATDTPPEIEALQLEGYRRMTPAQKIRQVQELNRLTRSLAASRIRLRYGPEISSAELNLRLAALHLDRQTMIEAFGWDPLRKGY